MSLDEWYWVYPRGDKLDLTDKVEPVAMFKEETAALKFAADRWPNTGEVHRGGINGHIQP